MILPALGVLLFLAVAQLWAGAAAPASTPDPAAAERDIRAAIADIRHAILAKSAAGIVERATADWTFTGTDGVTLDRAAFLVRTTALFARIVAIESLETAVDRIRFQTTGTAEVEITQTMVRSERAAETAAVTRLRLRYREKQGWVSTANGWRVQRVEFIGTPERTVLDPLPAVGKSDPDAMLNVLSARLAELDRALAQNPRDVALYSRRGDCHLFLGHAAAAVQDFEKMIALDPAQDAPHWRLGIAYYFAGQFAQSARQFEKYHTHDGGDRENGIWKFLGDVRTVGLERARAQMLPYTRFDREPFPDLYELFAGRLSPAAFFAGLIARHLEADPRVMFFAHYYAGLNEELLGRHEAALALLRQAVANPWAQTGESGPVYMWQVARVHTALLATEKP